MAISAFGAQAQPALVAALARCKGGDQRKALLLDLLLDCLGPVEEGGSDSCGATADAVEACCGTFVQCLQDEEPWCRHSAVQALELSSVQAASTLGLRRLCDGLFPLLADENGFVVWNAIGAIRYAATVPLQNKEGERDVLRELVNRLGPLAESHDNEFVRWKALETKALIFEQGFGPCSSSL